MRVAAEQSRIVHKPKGVVWTVQFEFGNSGHSLGNIEARPTLNHSKPSESLFPLSQFSDNCLRGDGRRKPVLAGLKVPRLSCGLQVEAKSPIASDNAS